MRLGHGAHFVAKTPTTPPQIAVNDGLWPNRVNLSDLQAFYRGNCRYFQRLKIVVSPVRVRVSPLEKDLQSAAFCGAFVLGREPVPCHGSPVSDDVPPRRRAVRSEHESFSASDAKTALLTALRRGGRQEEAR
jgi:hypothetical protein